MYRPLLRPGWILTHLAVIAIAVGLVDLGLWQLDRNAERQREEQRFVTAQQQEPISLEQALSGEDPFLRPITVRGTYLPQEEVQLSPRSRNELPGLEVLTPLRLEGGRTIVVNRGWIPLQSDPPPPPDGPVTLEGRIREPATARQVLPVGGTRAEQLSNVDLDVLDDQIPDLVTTGYVEVVDEEARLAGALPRPAEPPTPAGTVNNLSYALQWFAFAIIGLVGYPLLLRRRLTDAARNRSSLPVP